MMSPSQEPSFDLASILNSVDSNQVRNQYFDLLRIENKRKNLVSRETIENGLDRLFAESLVPFMIAPELSGKKQLGRYLDIGSGGGFPSIPILMTQITEKPVLIERKKTKSAALTRMLEQIKINAQLASIDFGQEVPIGRFDFVTMRLVRLTTPILKSILGLLSDRGIFVYYSKADSSIRVPQASYKVYGFTIENSPNSKSFTVIKNQQ